MEALLKGKKLWVYPMTYAGAWALAAVWRSLGVDAEVEYVPVSVPLAAGESLTLYTDGITDAQNEKGEFYGRPRLRTQLCTKADTVRGLGLRVLDDVKRFIGTRAQTDDMCLTCFGRV